MLGSLRGEELEAASSDLVVMKIDHVKTMPKIEICGASGLSFFSSCKYRVFDDVLFGSKCR